MKHFRKKSVMLDVTMNFKEIVEKAKSGNSQAFARIYDVYAQRIYCYIRRKLPSQQQAEDALQEIFLKAWKGLPNFQPKKGGLTPWLYRIATNQINDFYRVSARKPEPIELSDEIEPVYFQTSELESTLLSETAKQWFLSLPDLYRQVLVLRFEEDLSIKETAKVLNKTNLAIRLIQYRALKKIRDIIKKNVQI